MKYVSILPLSALIAVSLISIFTSYNFIPPGLEILESMRNTFSDSLYWVIFLIILLESIIFVGFYFPGQFFAVVLVIGSNPSSKGILLLTIAMVAAATFGSVINYLLGRYSKNKEEDDSPIKVSRLLLAMIHINSLAFFMFSQGANGKPFRIVVLAGLLNLPYYLLLIAATAVLSEQVMAMAENTLLLLSVISIWLVIAIFIDIKNYRQSSNT